MSIIIEEPKLEAKEKTKDNQDVYKKDKLEVLEEINTLEKNGYTYDSDASELIRSKSEFALKIVTTIFCHEIIYECERAEYDKKGCISKIYKVGWREEGKYAHDKHMAFGIFSKDKNK